MRKSVIIIVLGMLLLVISEQSAGQGCGEGSYSQPDVPCCSGPVANQSCLSNELFGWRCTITGYGECADCDSNFHQYTETEAMPDPNNCCDTEDRTNCLENGGHWEPATCGCNWQTPILLDVTGDGLHLTDASGGVRFQFSRNAPPIQTAWTAPGSDDAFLVLDRNGNGLVDDSSELFGDLTPQPPSETPNGFLALAVYDTQSYGGNGDRIIDGRDPVFARLRLWVDDNHDGISQPSELHTLPALGVQSLNLNYRASRRDDEFGNVFRYWAAVNRRGVRDDAQLGRWAVDVVFVMASVANSSAPRKPSAVKTSPGCRPATSGPVFQSRQTPVEKLQIGSDNSMSGGVR